MDAAEVKSSLCEVIATVQELSGLECPTLDGRTRPARDVKEFSSAVWPFDIKMLEDKIDIEIPEDDNLFYDVETKIALSIDQCVERVMMLSNNQRQHKKEKEASNE